ncbi:MAG TPA: right-handed parallel beta-helix repeat-containing protein [Candidatus Krumholzibacteria bacterium]|nr:right-handed parallel beta-helix repeat-containing protein [Candidatus Krumholzibacteria bacterium]
MKIRNRTALISALILFATTAPSGAAVWTVEKDGSGDCTVIQDAVDAAADGDTLMVGPGRFDDYRRVDLGVWQGRIIHVLLNNRSLTIIGAGQSETIIGPTSEFAVTEHEGGIVLVYGAELTLSDLTIERCYGGVECWDTSDLAVNRCTFRDHTWGVGCGVFSPQGAQIRDSQFQNYHTGVFPGSGSSGVIVERCEFRNMVYGMNTTATQNLTVSECRIEESLLGIQLWSNSTAALTDLDITTDSVSLVIKDGSNADLTNSRLLGSIQRDLTTVWLTGHCTLTGTSNILRGNGTPPLRIFRSDVTLTDSHLLTSSGYAVYCEPPSYPEDHKTIDLRNNWWGVGDADSVAALIFDANDTPDLDIYVDYLPFREEQVSSESMSMGDLKRLYR